MGSDRPLIKKTDNMRCMDAILAVDDAGNPFEPEWPEADFIIGNPPFLGDKKLRGELGDEYVHGLFGLYKGRVPNGADLCCYWFERARDAIQRRSGVRAGLLATNSIRQGKNRRVLERVLGPGGIFMAWSDRKWILDGAAVRISIVGFDDGTDGLRALDGVAVQRLNPDLTRSVDLTAARRLAENAGLAFIGATKKGPFDIPGDLARAMLSAGNPLGCANADVIRPYYNGQSITRRWDDSWVIDFRERPLREAALYEAPFEYVREHVLPLRLGHREKRQADKWWLLARPVPRLIELLEGSPRYLATSQVAKHRAFVWLPGRAHPDHTLVVFPRADDWFFGLLHSRAHERWALGLASALEDRPRYTPTTCFETFPFPRPTDEQRERIAAAAKALHETRQSALDNDPELTLTALYNKRPTWLQHLHEDLDRAVLDAYGWPPDITDEDLLERLLALNLERAAEEDSGTP
jgi:hypothetical protein